MASPELKFDTNTELASRRTGMSFQRTRMTEDRTLMAVIRTALSLIGFGFTIAQVFQKLRDQDIITKAAAPRNFGLALVGLGDRDACPGHRLSRAVHAGTAPFAGVDAGGRAHPWRERLSCFADADYCAHSSRHRGRGDPEYGVSRRTVRIGRRVAQS